MCTARAENCKSDNGERSYQPVSLRPLECVIGYCRSFQEEVNTNRYIVEEKLPKEIESKRAIVAELSKVADMPAINEADIAKIREKVLNVYGPQFLVVCKPDTALFPRLHTFFGTTIHTHFLFFCFFSITKRQLR